MRGRFMISFMSYLASLLSIESSGLKALDSSMDKFRKLRDEYRESNREYFGEHLFTILDQK